MRCTLDIYTDYLISSTGQATATGLSSLYDGAISHDQVTRLLSSSSLDSKDLWRKAKPLIRQTQANLPQGEFAVLIVDDSLAEKPHTDESALITTHWDHSQKRYIKGVNFLTLLYQASDLSVPIGSVLIEKTKPELDKKTGKTRYKSELTKNEHFRQLLTVAQQQVEYQYVLADSWYASAENINHVIGLDHHCIFALASSRTVALSEQERKQGKFQSLDAGPQTRASTRVRVFPHKAPLKVYLRSVQEALLLTRQVFTNKDGSQGCLYLITTDTTLSYDQITTIYQRRWKVEEYHKSLKQNASFGDSPTKNPDTQSVPAHPEHRRSITSWLPCWPISNSKP